MYIVKDLQNVVSRGKFLKYRASMSHIVWFLKNLKSGADAVFEIMDLFTFLIMVKTQILINVKKSEKYCFNLYDVHDNHMSFIFS